MLKFFEGLHTDHHPADQPEGTYRDAKNAVIYTKRGAVKNEHGNKLLDSLPAGYTLIGYIVLPDDVIVTFSTDNENSEIGAILNDSYIQILNDPDLNFSTEYPITGTYRVIPFREAAQNVYPIVVQEYIHSGSLAEDVSITIGDEPPPPDPDDPVDKSFLSTEGLDEIVTLTVT